MFLGEFRYSLDSKGRVFLPARYRDQLADGIVITRGLDGCLFVFASTVWEQFTEILSKQLPLTTKSGRTLSRFFLSGAMDVTPDKQGRISIPSYLREHAGLGDEVVIIGSGTRLELWNPERWALTLEKAQASVEEIAEQFSNITF